MSANSPTRRERARRRSLSPPLPRPSQQVLSTTPLIALANLPDGARARPPPVSTAAASAPLSPPAVAEMPPCPPSAAVGSTIVLPPPSVPLQQRVCALLPAAHALVGLLRELAAQTDLVPAAAGAGNPSRKHRRNEDDVEGLHSFNASQSPTLRSCTPARAHNLVQLVGPSKSSSAISSGDGSPPLSSSPPPPQPSEMACWEERLKSWEAAKVTAVEREDYLEAQRIKELLAPIYTSGGLAYFLLSVVEKIFCGISDRITVLRQAIKEAAAAEDFSTAAERKAQCREVCQKLAQLLASLPPNLNSQSRTG